MSKPDRNQGSRRELPITVLRYRDYRLVWAGEFVSGFGTRMHAVALSWQVFDLTGSVALLGVLGLVRAVALMSTALIGGAIADTRDRRKLLLVTNLLLLLLSAGISIATATGAVNVLLLYAVAMAVAATSAFDEPARHALIPTLVPRDRIPAAMSVNILTGNVAEMAGPAAGGLAVATLGIAGTYALDAVTFLAVVIALLAMKARPEVPVTTVGGLHAVREGLRFIRMTPVIYGIMLLDFLATVLGSTVGLAPVFADEILEVGPEGLGLLLSAPAIGAVAGGALLSLLPQPRHPGWLIVLAIVAYGLFLALFGIAPSLWLAMVFLAGAGLADALSMAMRHTIRNLATPDALRGRVSSAHSAFSAGGPRLGEFQSGMTASLIGAREAMVVGGFACVAAAGVLAWLIPAITGYRFEEEQEAA